MVTSPLGDYLLVQTYREFPFCKVIFVLGLCSCYILYLQLRLWEYTQKYCHKKKMCLAFLKGILKNCCLWSHFSYLFLHSWKLDLKIPWIWLAIKPHFSENTTIFKEEQKIFLHPSYSFWQTLKGNIAAFLIRWCLPLIYQQHRNKITIMLVCCNCGLSSLQPFHVRKLL